MMWTLIVFAGGMVTGAILDNRYAPKIRRENGKIVFEYSDKKKAGNSTGNKNP